MYSGPKKIKYKKTKKGRLSKYEFKANNLKFGIIGLKSTEAGLLNVKQIEAARQAIVRKIKRKGKLWIRIFPDLPVTWKSTGIWMGKGKGQVSHWVARVKGGTMLFEICGENIGSISMALKAGASKLPVKTKVSFF